METAEAILAIRSNWPDERYTMLREALTKAIAALKDVEAGQPDVQHTHGGSEDSTQICPTCGGNGNYDGRSITDRICVVCGGAGKLRLCTNRCAK